MPPLQLGLVLDKFGLLPELVPGPDRVFGVGAADPRRCRLDVAAVAGAELADRLLLRLGREAPDRQVGQ